MIAIVKCNRLRWAGHIVRMDPNRAPRKLFENDPEGHPGVGLDGSMECKQIFEHLILIVGRPWLKIEMPGRIF